MKNKLKRILTAVLAVMVMVVSMGSAEVNAATPAKLGKSDFVYSYSGKKTDFLKFSKEGEWAYYVYASLTSRGNECKGKIKDFTTKRKVKDGSSLAFVKKKYGNQKLKKIKSTTGFYKGVKYDEPQLDISSWKNYLAYSYKSGKDTYKLIFCFNKKNKVAGIIYLKNAKNLRKYPNKEINVGLRFKAPEGKKVTTKKIGGKKVYLLPKGTTVYYDKKYADEKSLCDCFYTQYDIYGGTKALSETDGLPSGKLKDGGIKYCYLWDSKKDTPKYKDKKNYELQYINMNKLGKYRYFTLYIFQVCASEDGKEYAPQIIYFKFV